MFRSTAQNHIRLMVIGEERVGKSALVVKYLTGRFIWEYQSDFANERLKNEQADHYNKEMPEYYVPNASLPEEFFSLMACLEPFQYYLNWKYAYQTNIDGYQVHMEIIDSLTMDDAHIRWAEGFMFVYDITNPDSVNRIEQFKNRLESVRSSRTFCMVVVGNKIDLEHCREVKPEKAELISSSLSAACHVSCSACGCELNVRFAFDELCREVAQLRQKSAQKRERRRSSLSQVRQGLKMLVQTGKNKNHTASVSENGGTSPVASIGGRSNNSRKGSKFTPSSPYSSLMSAPVLNDLPEETNAFFHLYSDDSDKKLRKSRKSSLEGNEEITKRHSLQHHKHPFGALVS